jgi:anti-sigma regulatory factor (Ser/Thr protein kinase)
VVSAATGAQTDSGVCVMLPAVPSSAAEGRRFAVEVLTRWDIQEFEERVSLLVSELVTNAVVHAGTDIELCLRRNAAGLLVTVRDESGALPVRRRYPVESATGRGLTLLQSLADSWGTELTEHGKVVWFTVDGSAPAG